MTNTDRETETATEQPAEMPLPIDPKVIFLGGLFVLALLAAAYVAGEIVLPLVFAFTIKLLCSQSCACWSACAFPGRSRRFC
jgi:hypothetical protein